MEFKLILCAKNPSEVVLTPETPLAGLNFIQVAAQCLRRSLDGLTTMRHDTLGTLATYTITVPQALAIESGVFEDSQEFYCVVPNNFLKDYVFYMASMNRAATRKVGYPYYQDSIVITSYIDELAVLDAWKNNSFTDHILTGGDGSTGCGCGSNCGCTGGTSSSTGSSSPGSCPSCGGANSSWYEGNNFCNGNMYL